MLPSSQNAFKPQNWTHRTKKVVTSAALNNAPPQKNPPDTPSTGRQRNQYNSIVTALTAQQRVEVLQSELA